MTLDKALKILKREVDNITLSPEPDVPAALQLGIEALEQMHNTRLMIGNPTWMKLPSETEK